MTVHRTRNGHSKKCFEHEVDISIFGSPEVETNGFCVSTQLKEIVMNEELQLEIVDLGDAKEETKGLAKGREVEANEALPYRIPA